MSEGAPWATDSTWQPMVNDKSTIDNLAVVILAHRDSAHLERLVSALPGCDAFVHWDAKSSPLNEAERVGSLREGRVRFLPRRDVRLASWSLVAVELAAVRVALEQSRADYIAIMSGADYPLVGPDELNESLAHRNGRSWVRNIALPYKLWDAPLLRDGGLWRWRWYFPTRNDHVLMVRSRPVFVPARRRFSDKLSLRASPHWKILSRQDAELLLRVLDEHPDLVRRGRHTFTPEESFLSSIMASPALFGERALAVDEGGPWYVSWAIAGGDQHPAWFSVADIAKVKGQRAKFERAGATRRAWPVFGRKFKTEHDDEIISKVRSELWSPTGR